MKLTKQKKEFLFTIILPFITPFMTLILQTLLWHFFNPYVWFLFYPTVFFMAWIGGMRGALISSVVSAFIVLWFFIPPIYTINKNNLPAYMSVLVFILLGYAFGLVQQKLRSANRELTNLNDKLKEMDHLKTEFFSNISHEFRTPLTLMLSPAEELLSKGENLAPERIKSYTEIIHRNALRLLKLVNTLLDFSRIEAGREQASYQATDISKLTAELASNFSSACEIANIKLIIDCPPIPEFINIDQKFWEKIVLNLMSNALKFTQNGYIKISIQTDKNCLILNVADTGIGISKKELPKLFDRFYRIEGSINRTYEGTGIGLSLVKELVNLLNGQIKVESEINKGTIFSITIPKNMTSDKIKNLSDNEENNHLLEAYRTEAHQLVSHIDRNSFNQISSKHKGLIIVADDNQDMLEYITRILEDAEYNVISVTNGKEALHQSIEKLPDLLLSDIMMPELNGFALLRELRSNPATTYLPIILLSARADETSKTDALQGGADDYLIKPFIANELIVRADGAVKLGRLRNETNKIILEAQEQIAKSELFYRSIFSSVSDALLILENNTVIDCNDIALELFKMTKTEFIGTSIFDYIYDYESEIESLTSYLKNQLPVKNIQCPFMLINEKNEKIVELTLSPLDNDLTKSVLTMRDITDFIQNEKIFNMQIRQAQMGEMISIIAHQWRQPLAVISAITSNIRLKEILKDQENFALIDDLRKIEEQTSHLSQIISEFRDMTSPNKPKKATSSSKIVQVAIDLFDHTFKTYNIQIEQVLKQDSEFITFQNEVIQVLLTLFKNILDAFEENQIINRLITITIDRNDKFGIITITDNAGGIPPHLIQKIFAPYFTTKDKQHGTRLGLYMSKMIIESHCHGKLEAESQENQSTFTIKLPLKES